ncbi:uncharacterized protein LOC142338543 [Convolutriloba macropyga]|uniref:uncharacterized protein LOC142338543 n=1 Tax=Convolutriloba macropyga TaxID=536237 RepID=UPI003F521165
MEALEISLSLNEGCMFNLNNSSIYKFALFDQLQQLPMHLGSSAGEITISPKSNLKLETPHNAILKTDANSHQIGASKRSNPIATTIRSPVKKANLGLNKPPLQPIGPVESAKNVLEQQPQLWAVCHLNNVRTFMCALCTYKTKKSSDIQRHCRGKHGDNLPQLKCSCCDFSTADKSKLRNHFVKIHGLSDMIAKVAVDATVNGE